MKKILSVVLVIVLMLSLVPTGLFNITVSAVTSDGYYDSGSCGTNVSWSYNESTQTLTISGTGYMEDLSIWDDEPSYSHLSSRIKHVVIKEGVIKIGSYAFKSLIFLQDIEIPNSIKSIGGNAFGSTYLKYIANYSSLTFTKGSDAYGGIAKYATFIGNYYKASGTCGTNATWSLDSQYRILHINGTGAMSNGCYSKWKQYNNDIIEIIINNGITSIGNEAFKGCTNVSSITIPNSVTSIGYDAFSNMTCLQKITIPDSITSIGVRAFYGCSNLDSVELSNKLTILQDDIFNGCINLSNITIPDSVGYINKNAFYGCSNLKDVELSNVSKIFANAFYNCTKISEIDLSERVSYIGSDAFFGCTGIERVNIASIKDWCEITFDNKYANPLYYSKELWLNGKKVDSLIIPKDISSVNAYSFIGCADLANIEFHSGVTSVGQYTFAECPNVSEVTLPKELADIGENAFDASVVIFGYKGSAAEEYAVQSGNTFYSSSDNTVNDLITWSYDKGTLYINGMNSIPNYNLFTSTPWYEIKDHIKSVEIDERITSVGTYSFYGCDQLVAIASDNKNLSFGLYSINTNNALTFYGYSGGNLESYCLNNDFNFIEHLKKPNIIEITPDTITVEKNASWLYSLDKINWTSNNIFKNLNECTEYILYIRRAEGLTPMAIRSSEGTVVKTLPYPTPDIPVLSKITADTIEVVKVEGLEYSLDKENWNETGKFTGLKCLTSYRIYARPITAIVAAQKISEPLAVTTPDYPTPEPPILNTVTDTTIAVDAIYGFEYSLDKINWKTSGKFAGLSPAQSYSVYVRPVTTIPEAQKVSEALVVTTLKSSVSTPPAPIIENYSDGRVVIEATEGYEYSKDGINWQNLNVFENIAYDTLYYFYQRVSETDTQYVSQSSSFTKIIIPSAPTINFIGATTLSIDTKDGYEYSLDKVYWQTSGEFGMLITDLDYTVYCRPVYQTSLFQTISEGVTVTVNGKDRPSVSPSAPTLISRTDTTVTLTFVEGYEYSKDGNIWQSNNVFKNLDPLTKYEFYQRVAETATNAASKPSNALIITTDKSVANKPSAPTLLSCDDVSVTLLKVSGYEYSKDGILWQTSNIFTGLSPVTQYIFYQRVAETDFAYASVSSSALSVTTDKSTPAKPSAPTLLNKTHNSITLTAKNGYEYSLNGVDWQSSNVFENLDSETNYTFYQRSAETTTCYASETSDALTIKTDAEPIYTVIFKNWDGTVLSTETYHYGDKVTAPANPTKEADNTYAYTFTGWDKEVTDCIGDTTYTAEYTSKYIDYNVVFQNWDGTVLATKTYHYGDKVTAPTNPERVADNTYTYTFKGWNNEVTDCRGNVIYTATYTSNYIDYTVVFKNWDGTVLSTKTYHYGDKIEVPNVPTKESDNTYTYTFAGWDKEVVNCGGNATYTAKYTSNYIDYTVVFKDWDGTVLSTETCHYGGKVTAPANPTKESDNTYTYTFTGWDKEVTGCIGDTTYTAEYTSKYIDYNVVFQNWDGTVLATKTYHYGDKVTAPTNPERVADNIYTYAFKGWNKEVVDCAGNTTYTATYNSIYIDYTVVFKDWNGTVLSSKTYHYGDEVIAPTPSKESDNTYNYVFSGWDKEVVNCEGNATYTARYTSNYIDYTVVFKDWDGTVLSTETYHYGDEVTVPTVHGKPAENGRDYIFIGWDQTVTNCTGDVIYTAVYIFAYTLGDLNDDREVTTTDLAVMKLYLAGLSNLNDTELLAGDLNEDGAVDTTDLASLKLLLAGINN